MNGTGIIALSIIVFVVYLAATGRLVRVVGIVTGTTINVPNTYTAASGGGGKVTLK